MNAVLSTPAWHERQVAKDASALSDRLRPTPLAHWIAQERVCSNLWEYSDFLAGEWGDGERVYCPYFGEISVQELVKIQFSPVATMEQLWEATQELKRRYLHDRRGLVSIYEEEALQ